MRCNEVQGILGQYWDLPDNDLRRMGADEHMRKCSACAEEFHIWRESRILIQTSAFASRESAASSLGKSVMSRIYADESWRMPIAERAYLFSSRTRRNLNAIIAFCLTLFVFSFVYSILFDYESSEQYDFRPGIIPVISAQEGEGTDYRTLGLVEEIPVASISSPALLKIGPIQSYPDYLVIVSILGIVFALLIMNWLSRVRT